MKILMSFNYNEGHGAIGRYVELVNSLIKLNDLEIYYISPNGYNRTNGKNFIHLGYKESRFKPNFIYAWFMISLIFIKKIIIIKKIEKCVLFNGLNSIIFAFYKSFFKYELIYSVRVNILHNAEIDLSLQKYNFIRIFLIKLKFKIISLFERYVIDKSDKIVFQSQKSADDYKKLYGISNHKIFILNNNCNPSWIGHKRKLKLKKGFNIGYIGNLYLAKGVEDLIKAFDIVKKQKNNCFLTIIGDGPDKKYFESYAKKLSPEKINFLGHQVNGFEFIHNFNLIVVPSYSDAFPNVILEAIYYKIPVIGSNVGGIPLILNNKQLFKAGDYKMLSKKILEMFEERIYQENFNLVKKIREKYFFDWGQEFHKIIKL